MWRYYIQILHYLRIPIFARPKTEPWDCVPSDNFLRPDTIAETIFAPCILSFVGMYMFAWDFVFPTPTEKLLWRVAAVYQVFYGIAGSLKCWYADVYITPKQLASVDIPPKRRIQRLAWKLRNIHVDRDPDLTVPLRVMIPNVFFCILYVLSRGFILVEDFIGLRSLPKSAFETVSWSKYIPHW